MKQQFLSLSLFIGLLLAMLCGCSDETIMPAADGERQGGRLTVNVTYGSYTASAGEEEPLTRVKEEGYKTTFTAGDKIGLYAVKNNAIITGYNNVCLTLAADGKWTPPAGTDIFYEGSDAVYYAYYPYQEAPPAGTLVPSSADADGFFANVVAQWMPAADQSSYAKYTASDLMTGKGTMSGTPGNTHTLSFTLTHRMALVILNLPKAKYSLSTDADYTWQADAVDTEFNNFAPRQLDIGVFHYLVNPAQATLTLSGSFSNDDASTSEWYIAADVAAGNYKTYKVDNGNAVNDVSYTLAIGDFFMKNGAIVPGSKETLNEMEQANCIGIVFKVGAGTQDNASRYDGKLTAIHGYVVSLDQANRSWGDNSKSWTNSSWYEYEGYVYTKILLEGMAQGKSFPACLWCVEHKPEPTGITSGWHFPSLNPVTDFVTTTLNTYLQKIPGSTAISSSGYYMSASESANDKVNNCIGRKVNDGTVYRLPKTSTWLVRAILTF